MSRFPAGEPIPKRMLPPPDVAAYYSDARKRGYLADPDVVARERLLLSQKYGYELPDLRRDPLRHVLLAEKDPRQIFFGLQPGWLVNLRDKVVYEPTDPDLLKYYHGSAVGSRVAS